MERSLEELKDILEDEIKKITQKGEITPTELDNMTKAVCLIEKINMIEEYDDDDYDDENSYYSRRRGRYSRRNYNYDNYDGMNNGRGSMRNSRNSHGDYSGHSIKDRMIDKLESMMDEAKTEYEKKIVSDWINRLDSE